MVDLLYVGFILIIMFLTNKTLLGVGFACVGVISKFFLSFWYSWLCYQGRNQDLQDFGIFRIRYGGLAER